MSLPAPRATDRVRSRQIEHSALYLGKHLRLVWNVSKNELRARYAGSLLGIAWLFLAPLLLLVVYAAVYIFILGVRVPGLTSLQYATFIFAGLVPFMMNAEAVSATASSVLSNIAVLNNTVFPVDLLPPKAVLMSQGVMVSGSAIVVVGSMASGSLSWTVALLPIVWLLHVAALVGLGWFLAILNVLFRDLTYAISVIIATLYVVSPIAYTREMVPPALAPLVFLNPIAYYVMSYQDVLVRGELPPMTNLAVMVLLSTALFGFGGWFFFRMKPVMVDYL